MKLHNHNSFPDYGEILYWAIAIIAALFLIFFFAVGSFN